MTTFRVHTTDNKIDVAARTIEDAKAQVIAKLPDTKILKIKVLKGK
jgi:hypothetical protein